MPRIASKTNETDPKLEKGVTPSDSEKPGLKPSETGEPILSANLGLVNLAEPSAILPRRGTRTPLDPLDIEGCNFIGPR